MLQDVTLFLWTATVVLGFAHSFQVPCYFLRKIMQEASLYLGDADGVRDRIH